MDMFEEARGLRTMIKMCNMTQNEIAEKMGVSQSYVANKLRLLNFSDKAQKSIIDAKLTERHARTLLRIADTDRLYYAIERIKERRLNVADSEALVDLLVEGEAKRFFGKAEENERIRHFEDFLTSSVESLVSLGINASKVTSYYGKKRYITVCIEEN